MRERERNTTVSKTFIAKWQILPNIFWLHDMLYHASDYLGRKSAIANWQMAALYCRMTFESVCVFASIDSKNFIDISDSGMSAAMRQFAIGEFQSILRVFSRLLIVYSHSVFVFIHQSKFEKCDSSNKIWENTFCTRFNLKMLNQKWILFFGIFIVPNLAQLSYLTDFNKKSTKIPPCKLCTMLVDSFRKVRIKLSVEKIDFKGGLC